MAWTHKRAITIDETKCGTADSSNFPMFFGGTYDGTGGEPDLRVTGSGGGVTNASGYDIAFFSDEACTTMLDFERHIWKDTTGVCEFWVEVPTLSTSANTVIYLAYGNSSISTDQQNKTGTWTADYEGVYHLGDATTLDVNSSTNTNNGTNSSATAVAGINGGGGAAFASGAYISLGAGVFGSDHAEISVSGWMKTSTQGTMDIVAKWSTDAAKQSWTPILIGGDTILAAINTTNGTDNLTWGTIDMIDGTWHYFAISGKQGADNFKLYQDTTVNVSTLAAFDADGNTGVAFIATSETNRPYTGHLDEIRISTSAKTPSWWAAEYNNQSSPSTFYSIGDDISTGTNMQINIGDSFKSVSAISINIGDAWKSVTHIWQNISDTWKTVF